MTFIIDDEDLAGDDTDDDDDDADDDDEACAVGEAAVVIYRNTWHPVCPQYIKKLNKFHKIYKYLQSNTNASKSIQIHTIASPDTHSVIEGTVFEEEKSLITWVYWFMV